ncbi:MAG TPA: permease [Runella sp.]|nr:permease [Runella sp.]HAO47843.1 permease [Runella sp.]
MEIIGYAGALVMGLCLGLIGSGGAILTVPILVYLFGVEPLIATTYSLFIVGLTSLVGATVRAGAGHIHWPLTLTFGIPSVVSVFLTRTYLLPLIPNPILQAGTFILSRSSFLLALFAVLMVFSSFSMIKNPPNQFPRNSNPSAGGYWHVINMLLKGFLVGGITGLLGAGGGFLIIPALVLIARLPMQQAVGTSLVIIATNSLTGFWRDYEFHSLINWPFLVHFSTLAVIGILLGSSLARKISGDKLKPIFGYFVLVMGFYILFKELFLS